MEIVISVVAKVAEYLVAPIAHPFTYCYSYKTNFEDLKKIFVELKNTRDTVQHRVDDSKLKGEEILPQVDQWMINADKVINEVEKLIEDEEKSKKRVCLNLKNRYQFSKMAERKVKAIAGLQERGRFNDVSYCTIPEEIWLKSTGDYMHFESRNSTLKKILDALGNPELNMIGVYGMGGIGKTTLVKEVARQAKKDELFYKVVTAHVSKTPDIKKIQLEIAEKLGLVFKEQSETGRAGRLYEQLKKEKQILIILDDIWGRLDLDAVGIPLGDGSSGCKVLLTGRIQDVLFGQMDSQHNFSVDVLNEKEAWSLFKKMAGDCIENGELKSVATDIVKVCAGMPLAIVTVARALRNKRLPEWKVSLRQLRRPSCRNFSGTQEMVYSCIELSYNHLEDGTQCSELKVIPPNVISRLLRLEELYMGYSWVQWEAEGLNTEKTNANLEELKYLSHLTALEINIGDASMIPKGLLSEKLQRFNIYIGDGAAWLGNSRMLNLRLSNNTSFQDGVIKLKGIEHLYLDNLLGVKNVPCELVGRNFSQLKLLVVQDSPDLEKICHGINNEKAIEFVQLHSITLTSLPQLRSFYSQIHLRSNQNSLDDEPLFNDKVG